MFSLFHCWHWWNMTGIFQCLCLYVCVFGSCFSTVTRWLVDWPELERFCSLCSSFTTLTWSCTRCRPRSTSTRPSISTWTLSISSFICCVYLESARTSADVHLPNAVDRHCFHFSLTLWILWEVNCIYLDLCSNEDNTTFACSSDLRCPIQ